MPSESASTGRGLDRLPGLGRDHAQPSLVRPRQVAPLRQEAGPRQRALDLRSLHEDGPDKPAPGVLGLQQRDPEVDADHVGVDPAGLRVERVDKAVAAPDPVPVGRAHVAQRGHRLVRDERHGAGGRARRDRAVEGVGVLGARRARPRPCSRSPNPRPSVPTGARPSLGTHSSGRCRSGAGPARPGPSSGNSPRRRRAGRGSRRRRA